MRIRHNEMRGISDYTTFSYKREKNVQENANGEFEDLMAGTCDTPGRQEKTLMSTGRITNIPLKSVVDKITYNQSGRLLLLDSNLGVNLDTVL